MPERPDSAFAGRKPRVAMLLGGLGRGGTEIQAVSLARGLAQHGCTVDLYVMYGDAATLQRWGPDRPAAELLHFGRDDHSGSGAAVLGATLRLRRRLAGGHYDVVHSALARAYVAAPVVAPLRHRPRLVAWRRDIAASGDRNHLANRAERWSARRTDAIIANSHAVARAVIEREQVPERKVHVIHNHLPPRAFDVQPSALPEDGDPRVVSVANLRAVKRLDVLIEALRRLRAGGRPVTGIFVGDGPELSRLERLAAAAGVPAIFPGSVLDPRIWLSAASVFVQASESEGLSTAMLEAMAQGKPIVATSVGGTAEALGDCGVLIPAGDPDAMARAIGSLLDDTDRARTLGTRARARACKEFSLETSVERHLAVYGGQ